jgi:aspartyl protease family protein
MHGATRALAWLAVAVGIYAGLVWYERHEAGSRIEVATVGADSSIAIRRDRDGHYRLPGTVNGEPVLFLIDTGATRTVIPRSVARRAGLEKIGSDVAKTAAGEVRLDLARADIGLAGGLRINALRVSVSPGVTVEALLGMDVLGELRFEQDGRILRIDTGDVSKPRPVPRSD